MIHVLAFCFSVKFLFELNRGSFMKNFYHFLPFHVHIPGLEVLKYTYIHIDLILLCCNSYRMAAARAVLDLSRASILNTLLLFLGLSLRLTIYDGSGVMKTTHEFDI